MGAILSANALPELPAFFFFGHILSALGMNTVLLTAAGTLGLRIWAYTVGLRLGAARALRFAPFRCCKPTGCVCIYCPACLH